MTLDGDSISLRTRRPAAEGQQLRNVVETEGLLAVDNAEAVGDEGVAELGVFTGEFLALGIDLRGFASVVARFPEGVSPSPRGGDSLP